MKITGIFVGLSFALALLIWVNLRSQKESETSVVTRIMLNYVQIFTSAAAFNLDWPKYLTEFFGIFSSVGEVAESLISFDCFLQDAGLTGKDTPTIYFNIISITLLPIAMGIAFTLFFLIWKMIFKTNI